jgi:SagB-type dehydrogenase family enzyme
MPAARSRKTRASAIGSGAESTFFRLSETASFSFSGRTVLAHALKSGTTLEFPRKYLPLVHHFAEWKPLFTAIMLAGTETRLGYPEVAAFVGELIQHGVLVPRRSGRQAGERPTWSNWGPSLNFYLGSRTREDERYLTGDELEAVLTSHAKRARQPSSYKDYPTRPFISLGDPAEYVDDERARDPFLRVLLHRRTSRAFREASLTRDHLSKLLYYTWGSTGSSRNALGEDVFLKKTSPSGGSLHSAEVYPILMNVEGVASGVYHYSVRRNGLELLSEEDPRPWIGHACGGQNWIGDSAAVFLTTSVLYRMAWKYQSSRALRVVLHDIGHLSQTFSLVATWLGLGAFTTGALRDEVFEKKIGLDFLEEPVFLLTGAGHVRHPRGDNARPRPVAAQTDRGPTVR